jgi:hypothetical protein
MASESFIARWLRALLSLWVLWVPAQGLALMAQAADDRACACDHGPPAPVEVAAAADAPADAHPCCPTKATKAPEAKAQPAPTPKPCCDHDPTAAPAPAGDGHDCGCVTSDPHDGAPFTYAAADDPSSDGVALGAPPTRAVIEQPLWRWERRAHALPQPRAPDWPQRALYLRLCVWLN